MRNILFPPRLGTPPMSSWYLSLTDWYLTFATAERPSVSLAAAAVQARRGPARPEAAVEVSRTSTTDRSFLNCESGVRVTPGAPILRIVSDHSSGLRRSCGGTCSTTLCSILGFAPQRSKDREAWREAPQS